MENPDTVIELDRSVVQQMFEERVKPQSLQPKPFNVSVIEGEARLNIAVSRVWFHIDANQRRWRQRDGTATSDLDRHVAFDLRLGDHPPDLGLENSTLVFTKVLGLPVPSGATTTCNGRQIRFNEIPLFGRLVIHDSLERAESTNSEGQPQQNVVLEFAPQPGRTLEAEPPAQTADSQMFGPVVQRLPDGRVLLAGMEPYVVWELTPSEQSCIRNTVVGGVLGIANIDVIDLVAEQLANGVVETLATLGDGGTSRASILPEPRTVDPTGTSGDPMQIDGIVRLWTRESASALEESLQVQIQTSPTLPEPLPLSVLALSTDETVGFMRAGFAIERSLRATQISSLCLGQSDFDPDAGCLLKKAVDIELDGDPATLRQFSAVVEESPELGHDVLNVRGSADGDTWAYGWYIEFGLVFQLDRGDVPRDPLQGELPPDLQPKHTLAEINASLSELDSEKCAGGDPDAIEKEQKDLAEEKNALPTEIGVKPQLFGEPFKKSDGWVTALGALAGIALVVGLAIGGLAIVAAASVSVEFTLGAVVAAFMIGYPAACFGLAALDNFYIDCQVSDRLTKFVDSKSKPGGDSLPLEGYSPTTVLRKDRVLRVFLAPLPKKLKVRFFDPDRPSPMGDPNFVAEQVAGFLADGRLWRLTVADAAHLVLKGRIEMSLETLAGEEFPLHVAHSSRGRRYLRTPHDDDVTNNQARLPPIPTV
jgi:hypothetical protein